MTIAVQVTRIKKKSENATIIGETNVVSNRFKLKRVCVSSLFKKNGNNTCNSNFFFLPNAFFHLFRQQMVALVWYILKPTNLLLFPIK